MGFWVGVSGIGRTFPQEVRYEGPRTESFPDFTDSLRTLQQLKARAARLSAFKGRAHGTPYAAKATRYLARTFQKMGYVVRVDTFPLVVYRIISAHLSVSSDGRHWRALRLGRDFVPSGSCPPIRGSWQVDTARRKGYAWRTLNFSPEVSVRAQREGIPLILIPRPKLIATVSTKSELQPILYIRDTLPSFSHVRLEVKGRLEQTIGWNVSARRKGDSSDSAWVIGAHYDHLGYIGNAVFWGGNDNSSGVAMLLVLAERLSRSAPPPYDVWFVAFGAEELGLIGSQWWVNHPPYPLRRLRGMLNLDLMGFGEKGVAVVGAADQPAFWQRVDHIRRVQGWDVPLHLRPMAPNSDQYPFYLAGVPALFFYLEGGPGYYHDVYDRPETLSWHAAYPFLRWIASVLSLP
ncbi:MAG: M28 family peptidase [Bacteroidia bacterium]|nr:M28 family peptidase [Bacteroidia bacterium]